MPIFLTYYTEATGITVPNSMLNIYSYVEFSTLTVTKFRQLWLIFSHKTLSKKANQKKQKKKTLDKTIKC